MHKKIERVKKDLDKGEKDLKDLKKADVKMDRKMDKMKADKKKMKGKC